MNNPVPASNSDGDENLAATPQGDFSLVIHDTSDEQYCLDMFRRALLKSDQHAREQLQQGFSGLGLSWIRLHPRREEACRYQKEEYYVAPRCCAKVLTSEPECCHHRYIKDLHTFERVSYRGAWLSGGVGHSSPWQQ